MSTYTEKERKTLLEIYQAEPTLETVTRLCNILNKPKKSIIAKLVKEGVYQKKGYRDKRGERPITKLALVRDMEEWLGIDLMGLDKTPKLTLKRLHTSIMEMQEMLSDIRDYKELAELRGSMLDTRNRTD